MSIKCEEYSQVCVVEVDGDFVGADAELARKTLEEQIDSKQIVDFIVDLGKASFIDSQGLETLLWMKRRCEDLFGRFKLVKLDENCKRILEITRLDHRFEIQDDLAMALKTMR
jgi:anti-anti-sigma factor